MSNFDDVDPDDVEREALFLLGGVNNAVDLEGIYTVLPLECPQELKGKPKPLYKYLLRHLSSETVENSDDGGLALFLKLREHLTPAMKAEVTTAAVISQLEGNGSLSNPKVSEDKTVKLKSKPLFDVQKLKDFKISGTIGSLDKRDSLSYSSLSYQISTGVKQGYTEEVICAAVLKAISPGNNLRTYLESKPGLDIPSLMGVMRSHFHEKDSSSVFTELSNAAQETSESCLDFVVRIMCLRQKVLVLGSEEGCPYDSSLVQKGFCILLKLACGITMSELNCGVCFALIKISRCLMKVC